VVLLVSKYSVPVSTSLKVPLRRVALPTDNHLYEVIKKAANYAPFLRKNLWFDYLDFMKKPKAKRPVTTVLTQSIAPPGAAPEIRI